MVTIVETVLGLAHPAGGHLDLAGLSPAKLFSGGFGTFGVLAVIAVLGFVGFEQAPVYSEEARTARRTMPTATYLALGAIAVVYAGASWAMSVHAGPGHVVAAAPAQGPGLLFGLGGSGGLSQAAQLLFMTSLFAAALAFHNVVWRYMYALGREHVLPAALGRTGGSNIPRAASLVQSAVALAVIVLYAATGLTPMTKLFFWLGTTGGFGILVLLALTSVSVIAFFARDHHGEAVWRRVAAPALAAGLLGVIVVLALLNYGTLLGSAPGDTVNWVLPGQLRRHRRHRGRLGPDPAGRRPEVYAAIGLGARAVTVRPPPPSRPLPRRPPSDHRRLRPRPSPPRPADLDAVSQVIAVAFHDLPPSQWLVSDPAEPGGSSPASSGSCWTGLWPTAPSPSRPSGTPPRCGSPPGTIRPTRPRTTPTASPPSPAPGRASSRRSTSPWRKTTRPASRTNGWPSSASAPTGRARASAAR